MRSKIIDFYIAAIAFLFPIIINLIDRIADRYCSTQLLEYYRSKGYVKYSLFVLLSFCAFLILFIEKQSYFFDLLSLCVLIFLIYSNVRLSTAGALVNAIWKDIGKVQNINLDSILDSINKIRIIGDILVVETKNRNNDFVIKNIDKIKEDIIKFEFNGSYKIPSKSDTEVDKYKMRIFKIFGKILKRLTNFSQSNSRLNNSYFFEKSLGKECVVQMKRIFKAAVDTSNKEIALSLCKVLPTLVQNLSDTKAKTKDEQTDKKKLIDALLIGNIEMFRCAALKECSLCKYFCIPFFKNTVRACNVTYHSEDFEDLSFTNDICDTILNNIKFIIFSERISERDKFNIFREIFCKPGLDDLFPPPPNPEPEGWESFRRKYNVDKPNDLNSCRNICKKYEKCYKLIRSVFVNEKFKRLILEIGFICFKSRNYDFLKYLIYGGQRKENISIFHIMHKLDNGMEATCINDIEDRTFPNDRDSILEQMADLRSGDCYYLCYILLLLALSPRDSEVSNDLNILKCWLDCSLFLCHDDYDTCRKILDNINNLNCFRNQFEEHNSDIKLDEEAAFAFEYFDFKKERFDELLNELKNYMEERMKRSAVAEK
jgi:hypothetical protein